MEVELGPADGPHAVVLGEHGVAGGAPRPEHPVEVGLAVELAELGEAGVCEGGATGGTLEAVLVTAVTACMTAY